jgi:DNA-binding response OmpR family regulator
MAKKVLIAEDDALLLSIMSVNVGKLGYIVVKAHNGTEAIAKFKESSPDLLLLDIIMPEKTGLEALEEIRNSLKSKVPVIILSNLDNQEYISKSKELGVSDYIVKSNISLRLLSRKISDLIGTEEW